MLWAALGLLWLVPGPGRAADRELEATLRYEHGLSLYKTGHLVESLAEFQAAYAIKPLPKLLFNIGQLHRKLGHTSQALAAYTAYRNAQPSLPPEEVQEVEAKIAACQKLLAAQPVPRRTRPQQTLGWILGGVGLASLAAGAALWALDGRGACALPPGQTRCPQMYQTLIPGVTFAVAGVSLLGTSGLLLGLDFRAQRHGERLAMLRLGLTF